MALNVSDPKELYKDIKRHVGHKIVAVQYGFAAVGVAIECEDCDEVLLDADIPK